MKDLTQNSVGHHILSFVFQIEHFDVQHTADDL